MGKVTVAAALGHLGLPADLEKVEPVTDPSEAAGPRQEEAETAVQEERQAAVRADRGEGQFPVVHRRLPVQPPPHLPVQPASDPEYEPHAYRLQVGHQPRSPESGKPDD